MKPAIRDTHEFRMEVFRVNYCLRLVELLATFRGGRVGVRQPLKDAFLEDVPEVSITAATGDRNKLLRCVE